MESERAQAIAHVRLLTTADPRCVTKEEASRLLNYYERFRDDMELSTEVIRCLRNACSVANDGVRDQVIADGNATVRDILKDVAEGEEDAAECKLVRLRCSLQLIHNLLVDRPAYQLEMLQQTKTAITRSLASSDIKLQNYASSILLLLLKSQPQFVMIEVLSVSHIFRPLLSAIRQEAEFALFCVNELLESYPEFVCSAYKELEEGDRLTVSDVLLEHFAAVPAELVRLLVSEFKQHSSRILIALQNSTNETASPTETVKLLAVLCEMSGAEATRTTVQADKSLLIDATYLLRMLHDVGKSETANMFTPVNKIAQLTEETSPVWGFKRDLVRLVGNMCWDHRDNQDQAREIDAIPLLLDCSPIDGKNPFMLQWVIFAIRNLCHNNRENQDIIAKLDGRGANFLSGLSTTNQ